MIILTFSVEHGIKQPKLKERICMINKFEKWLWDNEWQVEYTYQVLIVQR